MHFGSSYGQIGFSKFSWWSRQLWPRRLLAGLVIFQSPSRWPEPWPEPVWVTELTFNFFFWYCTVEKKITFCVKAYPAKHSGKASLQAMRVISIHGKKPHLAGIQEFGAASGKFGESYLAIWTPKMHCRWSSALWTAYHIIGQLTMRHIDRYS